MYLTIHRGTHEIGGSCVELQTKQARILIDLGLPLTEDKPKDKKQLIKLLPKGLNDMPELDAILISHAHPDHYGLLSFLHQDVPMYMSKGTKKLIEISYIFNQSNCDLKHVTTIEAWKPFEIKDIKITPYLVDHSGFDAMAFLIEAENKRIFYSGDFRGHGRKDILFKTMIKDPIPSIDYLIMEGTMLTRSKEGYKTEEDIEKEMVSILNSNRLTFLACSSQNIDRIVSAYKACRKTDTIFVIDPYTACVLDTLKDIAKGVPQYNWGRNMKVFCIPGTYSDIVFNKLKMYKFGKNKITKEEVFSLKDKMLVKDSYTMRNIFRNHKLLKGTKVIYSMWEGYLDKQKSFWEKNNVPIIKLHTSGHAYVQELIKFVDAMKPKYIIPIHTENPKEFKETFKTDVILLEDGEKREL